jgi:hypothetical protein
MGCNTRADRNVDFQVFLVAGEPIEEHMTTHASMTKFKGNVAVLSSRAKTGFSGMITVSVVLLAMQFITGVQAFPL